MNEDFIKQVIAELIAANGQALGTVVAALARQIDPEQLTQDLRAQIQASKQTSGWTSISEQIANHALAAAEAETALRKQANH